MILGVEPMSTVKPRQVALTDALLRIVAEHGLDQVSVREVASAAGVSIGTVQHYFPTKDAMLAAAFTEVVRRIRVRVAAVEPGPDLRANLSAVLRELLPLDARRADEVRIQLAFAARAATAPALADIQRGVLTEVMCELAEAFSTAGGGGVAGGGGAGGGKPVEWSRSAARLALAATDGLALHAVSSGGWLSTSEQGAALEHLLDALLAGAE